MLNMDKKKRIIFYTGTAVLFLLLFSGVSYLLSKNTVFSYIIAALFFIALTAAILYAISRIFFLQDDNTELKTEATDADHKSDLKTEFLSDISHGIRTPLNAILGYTELAIEDIDNKDAVKDYLNKIDQSGNHLLELINSILELNRIETGHMVLCENECSLTDIAAELENIFENEIKDKGLLYISDLSEVENPDIYGDHLKIKEILINLLSNAIKYTPKGGSVSLIIKQQFNLSDDLTAYDYRFTVKDTGIGFDEQKLSTIFEPFEAVKEATTNETADQSTGLGLAITKDLVKLMGGDITVNSSPGNGTEFNIDIVFHVQVKAKLKQVIDTSKHSDEDRHIVDFTGKRALVVDDNRINREIAGKILSSRGFTVDYAVDGHDALTRLRDSEPGLYDTVLMDIQMPVMNGYEATQNIRELPGDYYRDIPIIAMTAKAFYEDREAALKAGMNGHVSKPIDIENLFSVLEEFLDN